MKKFYLILFCVFLIGIFITMIVQTSTRAVLIEKQAEFPVIVIDPGHGGVDGGAVAKDGTVEKGINLSISKKLADKFTLLGYKVITTRDSDISIHDDDANTIRQKKVTDLHNRLKLAESYDATLISIHQNNFGQSKYRGTQVFYGIKNDQSKLMAEKIQSTVRDLLQPNNDREIKPSSKSIYLLHNIKTPAVLVECGFLSNADETALLKTDAYQEKLSFAILCGYVSYQTIRK